MRTRALSICLSAGSKSAGPAQAFPCRYLHLSISRITIPAAIRIEPIAAAQNLSGSAKISSTTPAAISINAPVFRLPIHLLTAPHLPLHNMRAVFRYVRFPLRKKEPVRQRRQALFNILIFPYHAGRARKRLCPARGRTPFPRRAHPRRFRCIFRRFVR